MAQEHQPSWQEFMQVHDEIRQNLEKLGSATKHLGKNPEGSEDRRILCDAIHSVFSTLLDIWMDAIATIKESPKRM
jgi:hypothetical protein